MSELLRVAHGYQQVTDWHARRRAWRSAGPGGAGAAGNPQVTEGRWEASRCPACLGRWPPADHRIADCGLTVAYLHADQFFPGWTILVLKRHATELFELSREESSPLTEEMSAMARALAAAFRPVKINYGLLGNRLPHIHWHIVPRLAGDPAPREAVWGVPHEAAPLPADGLRDRIARIRAHLPG